MSRAIVSIDGADDRPLSTDRVFATAAFERATIADALADATRWLDRQPPSSREIVIRGTLRRGAVSDADLSMIPPAIGIRFEHVPATSPNDVSWPVLTRRNGSLVRLDRALHFEADATRVADGATTPVADDLITIAARDADRPLAEAALGAALDAGVAWSNFERRVVVAWEGADVATATPGIEIIRMPVPSPPASAADAVLASLRALSPSPAGLEPVMIAPEQLSAWSRAPGPPATTAPLADEGDRRAVWAVVLALLALEAWMRRSPPAVAEAAADAGEARVA